MAGRREAAKLVLLVDHHRVVAGRHGVPLARRDSPRAVVGLRDMLPTVREEDDIQRVVVLVAVGARIVEVELRLIGIGPRAENRVPHAAHNPRAGPGRPHVPPCAVGVRGVVELRVVLVGERELLEHVPHSSVLARVLGLQVETVVARPIDVARVSGGIGVAFEQGRDLSSQPPSDVLVIARRAFVPEPVRVVLGLDDPPVALNGKVHVLGLRDSDAVDGYGLENVIKQIAQAHGPLQEVLHLVAQEVALDLLQGAKPLHCAAVVDQVERAHHRQPGPQVEPEPDAPQTVRIPCTAVGCVVLVPGLALPRHQRPLGHHVREP